MSTIPLSRPCLGEQEEQAVRDVLRSGWVTQGPKVAEFERDFAEFTGAAHACAVSSGTAALHLALRAVGVGPGDVVLSVSHSFIATANAIRHSQAEPVFVDIDALSRNLCPAALRRVLDRDFERQGDEYWYRDAARLVVGESPLCGRQAKCGRLAALLVVHQLGMPADLGQLLPIARQHRLPVVEDAACAVGSRIRLGDAWEPIGRPHGDVACFSFHPRKVITTGDGGMLCTNDARHDQLFRLWRQHGMSVSDAVRHQASAVIVEQYATTGFNYRLTDLQAAVGIEQLKRLPGMLARRRELAADYARALAGCPEIELPHEPAYASSNWQSYAIRLRDPRRQPLVMQALLDRGISTRRGVMCAHLEMPYAPAWPVGSLPASEDARNRDLILPLFPDMSPGDVQRVAGALREVLAASHRASAA